MIRFTFLLVSFDISSLVLRAFLPLDWKVEHMIFLISLKVFFVAKSKVVLVFFNRVNFEDDSTVFEVGFEDDSTVFEFEFEDDSTFFEVEFEDDSTGFEVDFEDDVAFLRH